jgi:hypothetical protein
MKCKRLRAVMCLILGSAAGVLTWNIANAQDNEGRCYYEGQWWDYGAKIYVHKTWYVCVNGGWEECEQ